MTILVRRALDSELDEVGRMLASAFEQHRSPRAIDPRHQDLLDRYLEEVANVRARLGETELFVAVEAGRVVGTGTLYPPGRTSAYASAVHCKAWPDEWASLRLLGVDPAHRGRGIGRMLVEARVKRARELGAPVVALHTSRHFDEARRMIENMGWTRSPSYDHEPIPDVCAEAYVLPLTNR